MIKEIIVVEGRDDVTAVKRALDAELITTGGFGFPKGLWKELNQHKREEEL
ncbi:putative ribonuclease M5 [[Clostridium] sordellii ATCC 9714]|nr:putative ribonuclease M5 [[Clostridium] sordellii ATCC 9714] [Paeniclostridium sordellii ATCC 9714]